MSDEGKLGVVLVTHQSADDLPSFLESLPAAVGSHPYDLLLVDNASSDASVALAEKAGAQVTRNATNVGLSAAINQGAAQTEANWLVPSPVVGILHALLGPVWPTNPATRAYHGADRRSDAVSSVDWVSGSCMVFRREAFDAIGGFDTNYFMHFEEVDVCLRLHQTGWKVVLDPSVAIFHREGGSTRHAPFRKVVNHHRSALRFYCRYHRGDPWLLFAPVVALGLVLRALASLVRTGIGRVRGKWVVGRS